MTRATYLKLVAAMIILAAISSVLMVQIHWFGDADSTQAGPIDTLFDVMIILSCLVFSIVMVMFIYAIWRWRAKPGDESDGEPIHGNTKLEIAWTAIPTIIVLVGAIYSWIVLNDIEAKASDRMPLNVTAQQFKWTFEYPQAQIGTDADGNPTYVTTSALHVPVDRQLDITLTALDVVHSFWVPEWRIKRDAVPAGASGDEIDNEFVVTPNAEGSFSLICTELCGTGHSTMRAPVVVESQQDFEAWLAKQTTAQRKALRAASGGGGSAGGQSGT